MWTRDELKTRARANLSRYYGPALFVSFIANLFTSKGGSGGSAGSAGGFANGMNSGGEVAGELGFQTGGMDSLEDMIAGVPGALDSFVQSIDPVMISVMASVLLVSVVIGLVLSIFVAPIFIVGRNRYYMESRAMGYSAGVQELLWGFTHNYLNIVWTMFLKNFIVVLSSFCCFIPGIYFGYCYYMVPYILAENPDIKATDALRMSKDMMDGHKLNTFVLEISFWGWWILGALVCGVGGVLVQPYYDATFAELYAVLRRPFNGVLNGFGHPEDSYGPYGCEGPSGWSGGYGQPYEPGHYEEYRYDSRGYGNYGDSVRNGGDANAAQQQFSASERNEFESSGQEPQSQRNAERSGNAGYGYYEREREQFYHEQPENMAQPSAPEERGYEVNRPESAPRRGYYLNGVFCPYTDEELRELEDNRHKN